MERGLSACRGAGRHKQTPAADLAYLRSRPSTEVRLLAHACDADWTEVQPQTAPLRGKRHGLSGADRSCKGRENCQKTWLPPRLHLLSIGMANTEPDIWLTAVLQLCTPSAGASSSNILSEAQLLCVCCCIRSSCCSLGFCTPRKGSGDTILRFCKQVQPSLAASLHLLGGHAAGCDVLDHKFVIKAVCPWCSSCRKDCTRWRPISVSGMIVPPASLVSQAARMDEHKGSQFLQCASFVPLPAAACGAGACSAVIRGHLLSELQSITGSEGSPASDHTTRHGPR